MERDRTQKEKLYLQSTSKKSSSRNQDMKQQGAELHQSYDHEEDEEDEDVSDNEGEDLDHEVDDAYNQKTLFPTSFGRGGILKKSGSKVFELNEQPQLSESASKTVHTWDSRYDKVVRDGIK